jgi:hypothetical protein
MELHIILIGLLSFGLSIGIIRYELKNTKYD